MDIHQVIKFYGDEVTTAAALGKSQQCIINWRKANELKKPLTYWNQAAIQTITKGALKASVK